jgi:glycosyltransferase involved in cell wall biosynthesis
LLHAFAQVLPHQPCRLVLLGEGKQRPELQRLATELGVEEHVWMPGFVTNPYSYMARAAVFVLSSAWEGFGNVLVEALALGVPVVATDCPSGPREILQGGRYGALVPVGDSQALARAVLETLYRPLPRELLRGAAGEFTVEASAVAYLDTIGLHAGPEVQGA